MKENYREIEYQQGKRKTLDRKSGTKKADKNKI